MLLTRKYRNILFVFLALTMAFLPACAFNQKEAIPQYVLEAIKANRVTSNADTLLNEIQGSLYQYTDYSGEPAKIITQAEKKDVLTKAQAEEDIRYLFTLFHYGYAGYGYFGGDAVFNKAEQETLKAINDQKGESIKSSDLAAALVENLSFLQDGHFALGYNQTIKQTNYLDDETTPVRRDGNHYYAVFDQDESRILSINGEAPEKYLKLSLDKDGKIVYYIGTLSQEIGGVYISVKYEYGSTQKTQDIYLCPELNSAFSDSLSCYAQSSVDGIPVITSDSFMATSTAEVKEVNKFCESAKAVRNRPSIVDISRNGGGDSEYADKWFYNYTGIKPQISMATEQLCTQTSISLFKNVLQAFADESHKADYEKAVDVMLEKSQNKTDPYLSSCSTGKKITNSSLLVVITGKKTMSSGEWFANDAKTLNNTLFAGTNTFGAQHFGNVITTYLPNSGLPIRFGTTCYNFGIKEGVGLMPDFWMNPDDAPKRVAKFIERYDISSIKNIKFQ